MKHYKDIATKALSHQGSQRSKPHRGDLLNRILHLILFSFVFCGLMKAQSCYEFHFNITDSTGKNLKIDGWYSICFDRIFNGKENVSKHYETFNGQGSLAHIAQKDYCGSQEYHGVEYYSFETGCEGDSVEWFQTYINYNHKTMAIIPTKFPMTNNKGEEFDIVNIKFRADTTLIWEGKIDNDNKPIFRAQPSTYNGQ